MKIGVTLYHVMQECKVENVQIYWCVFFQATATLATATQSPMISKFVRLKLKSRDSLDFAFWVENSATIAILRQHHKILLLNTKAATFIT